MSQPVTIEQAMKIALQHHEAGRLAQAETIYRQVLQQAPHHADAMHLLGVVAHQVGKNEVAIDLILRAIAIKPREAPYYSNLGEAYRMLGMVDAAMGAYRQAIAVNPGFPEAYSNMGNVLCELKHNDEAMEYCLKAIAIKPTLHQAWNNLGNTYEERHEYDKAFDAYKKAVELNPNFSKAYSNMGISLHQRGFLHEAADAYEKAIACDPGFADAHWNCSLALLLTGQFERGWEEYEWRWKSKDFPSPIRNFSQPLWTGQDLAGKSILLHAEQGFGDAIQFARYIPLVAQRGGTVFVDCQPELTRLFQSLAGPALVVDRGAALPPFDYHSPFLSLPRTFKTRLDNIPAQIPYLQAVPETVALWKQRLCQYAATQRRSFTVGIAWAGRPTHKEDKNRSQKLAAFAPLAAVPGVCLVSLQKGPAVTQIADCGFPVFDTSADLKDFTDTAALIKALDLVVSVDTSIVHLTGALAKPVWTMIAKMPDWRWLLDRTDTPWYPTMRLFRQQTLFDWTPVIAQIADELRRKLNAAELR